MNSIKQPEDSLCVFPLALLFPIKQIFIISRYLHTTDITSLQNVCKHTHNEYLLYWKQKCQRKYTKRVFGLFNTIHSDADLYKYYRCAGGYEEYQIIKKQYSSTLFYELHKKTISTKQWRNLYESSKIIGNLTRDSFIYGRQKIFLSKVPIYFPTKICKIQEYYPSAIGQEFAACDVASIQCASTENSFKYLLASSGYFHTRSTNSDWDPECEETSIIQKGVYHVDPVRNRIVLEFKWRYVVVWDYTAVSMEVVQSKSCMHRTYIDMGWSGGFNNGSYYIHENR